MPQAIQYPSISRILQCISLVILTGCGCAKPKTASAPAQVPAADLAVHLETSPSSNTDQATSATDSAPDLESADEAGSTPLMRACWLNRPEEATSLIKAGANVNATTKDGWTPLMSAARGGCVPCITMLLKFGAALD